MKRGGGKQKGSAFERKVCEQLSYWITDGKRRDCLWRSAISGGRATVALRKDRSYHAQAGDISAVAPEGHALISRFLIECKFYKRLQLDQLCCHGNGLLASFWQKTCEQAADHGKEPLLIAKQNRLPTLLVTKPEGLSSIVKVAALADKVLVMHPELFCEIRLFDDVLALKYEPK